MKYEIRHMLAHGGGTIVNNASITGLVGVQQHGMYSASKHAVQGLTKTAALEYGIQGIRINAVSPGVIETPMLDAFTGDDEEQKKQIIEALTSMHPIGRFGQPEEIAKTVLWLCSDDASFMLGQSVPVDGGFTAA